MLTGPSMPSPSAGSARHFGRGAALAHYFRRRSRVLGACAALGLAAHGCLPRPPEPKLEELRTWLGQRIEHGVSVGDLRWEPRAGTLEELVFGRAVWLLAAPQPGAPRDLYRAWVRLAPDGQPLSVRRVVRVTDTPEADESGLVLNDGRLAFGVVARGRVRAVSVLEPARGGGPRVLSRLVARERTGDLDAFARTDLVLDANASAVAVTLEGAVVRIDLGDAERKATYDLERHAFTGDVAGLAHALERPTCEGTPRLELLALSRAFFGLELSALAGRAWFRLVHGAPAAAELPRAASQTRVTVSPLSVRPLGHPFLKPPLGTDAASGEAEPYLFRATLDANATSTPSPVELVALDVRQLELGVGAGSAWPTPAFGVAGDGKLPSDPARYRRVVAVFNAGPEAAYTRYGAMTDGRLLAPPEARHASVVVTRAQEVRLGAWPYGDEVPADVSSFTQRRTALVSAGVPVPSEDASVRRRTALCTTGDARLVYAYTEASDANALARALARAGCEYALPLATSPEALGFALADVRSPSDGRFELVLPGMDFDAHATLAGTTRDFFYVLVRDMLPKLPPGVAWTPDGGTQPTPTRLPGILHGELTLGGVTVKLVSFAGGRFDFKVRPGPLEPGAKGQAWSGALTEEDRARALAELELGHATGATRLGLALGTLIPLPLRPASATLVVGAGTARVLVPGEAVTLAAGEHAVQLPLLAGDSEVTERARERGDQRLRAALGVTDDGRLVIATLRHDSSDPLAVALRAAGCRRVVELDRGSHHPAALERAGTETPPREAPESTTLWVLGRK